MAPCCGKRGHANKSFLFNKKGRRKPLTRVDYPVYDRKMPSSSQRTKSRSFRISHTQYKLLGAPLFKDRASPLIRVLLHLYLNRKLDGFNIEELVNKEVYVQNAAEKEGQKNILKFNESRKRGDS